MGKLQLIALALVLSPITAWADAGGAATEERLAFSPPQGYALVQQAGDDAYFTAEYVAGREPDGSPTSRVTLQAWRGGEPRTAEAFAETLKADFLRGCVGGETRATQENGGALLVRLACPRAEGRPRAETTMVKIEAGARLFVVVRYAAKSRLSGFEERFLRSYLAGVGVEPATASSAP